MTTTPAAARPLRVSIGHAALTILVAGACLWLLAGRLADIDPAHVAKALARVEPVQWLGAALCVAISFIAVSRQEQVLLRHVGLRIPPVAAARAAIAAAAIGQTVGFGPITGAMVRRRLLPGLPMWRALQISTAMTFGFAGVIAILTAVAVKCSPHFPYQQAATGVLIAGAAGLLLCAVQPLAIRRLVRLPNLFTAVSFLGWLALDLVALALTLWILFPAGATPNFSLLLPAFLLAFGAGLASGAPAGVGVFEVTLFMLLPGMDEPQMMAAVLAYRAIAYAVPALGGAILAIAGPGTLESIDPPAEPAPATACTAPRAEVRLAGQSGLALVSAGEGRAWLSAALPHSRVAVGSPFPIRSRSGLRSALAHLGERAEDEACLPCLYKAEARLAATARRAGFRVQHIADEAWLVPRQFTDMGHHHAGLRRKLRHAAKAGVACAQAEELPLAAMAHLSRLWVAAHGGERGFSVGRFDEHLVRRQRVFLAHDAGGQPIAFVTFHTVASEWALDLVRFGPGLPDGTMHALIRTAIAAAAAEEVPRLSLAAVPVAGFGLTGRLGTLAARLTERSNGLLQFKRSFAPRWSPLYLAAPGRIGLAVAALELMREIHRRR